MNCAARLIANILGKEVNDELKTYTSHVKDTKHIGLQYPPLNLDTQNIRASAYL